METTNLLSKAEMKHVMGGRLEPDYGDAGSCAVTFNTGKGQGGSWTDSSGATDITFNGAPGNLNDAVYVVRGLSKSQALALVANGGRWCCEGCATASWY